MVEMDASQRYCKCFVSFVGCLGELKASKGCSGIHCVNAHVPCSQESLFAYSSERMQGNAASRTKLQERERERDKVTQ